MTGLQTNLFEDEYIESVIFFENRQDNNKEICENIPMLKDQLTSLVEDKRPPIYTAMKYWGKKPHNIWRDYIDAYTPDGGIVLDPFAGSAIGAFEAVKLHKKAIALDINPLTSFLIEVYGTKFNVNELIKAVNSIVAEVEQGPFYKLFYVEKCKFCGKSAQIQHFKWDSDRIYEYGVTCPYCKEKYIEVSTKIQNEKAKGMDNLAIPYWYPKDNFYSSPSFSDSFIKNIGGNNFSKIWTRRNLFLLSHVFDLIRKQNNNDLKLQLLFGFIQTLHLASKMCVPRRKESNRAFSTSWGRPAYICSKRQMEMNPLMLFKNNCLGKQSVQSALGYVKPYIGNTPAIARIDKSTNKTADIKYGIIDIKALTNYLLPKSVDFIITDPPYGGVVQYLDLSYVWLVWLKKIDKRFKPRFEDEITIKKGIKDTGDFEDDMTQGLMNLYTVLKDNGKAVFTFHNQNLEIWEALLKALYNANFEIESIVHQYNKRTSESNVSGTSIMSDNDFYIICTKKLSRYKLSYKVFQKNVLMKIAQYINYNRR